MSYLLCDKCSSIRAEYFCDDCEQGYYKYRDDHVSKSELRAWCEGRINICTRTKTSEAENELQCRSYYDILEKFCKGDK